MSIITSEITERMTSSELIDKLNRFIPDLNQVEAYLKGDPEELISSFFPLKKHGSKIKPADSVIDSKKKQKKLLLEEGLRALQKIRLNKDVKLDRKERFALCSIVVNIGRPALLIQNDHFPQKSKDGKSSGLPPNWWILDEYRGEIEKTCKSVGRIEHSDPYSAKELEDPDADDGTGFLIAEDIVITNKHVIDAFAFLGDNKKWKIRDSYNPRIDFAEEYDSKVECEFAVKSVIGVHETLEIALVRIETRSCQGTSLPEPLVLDSELPEPTENRNVYLVGYPFQGYPEDNPRDLELIFNDILGYKRLQPGVVRGKEVKSRSLYHDCTAIGGNSGSCVVDLERNKVIGLHYGGKITNEFNEAVSLSLLKNDSLFSKVGIKFS